MGNSASEPSESIARNSNEIPIHTIDIPDGALPSAIVDGPPPSYDDLDPNAAQPPSYDSLFAKVKEARQNSGGFIDFVRIVLTIVVGTLAYIILSFVLLAIPMTMIILGSVYLHDCPAEPYIPIYMIVGGIFWFVSRGLDLKHRMDKKRGKTYVRTVVMAVLVDCFQFAWFIAGCVWIYRIYEPSYDYRTKEYCNATLYMYAFWLQNLVYIVFGTLVVCVCALAAVTH